MKKFLRRENLCGLGEVLSKDAFGARDVIFGVGVVAFAQVTG